MAKPPPISNLQSLKINKGSNQSPLRQEQNQKDKLKSKGVGIAKNIKARNKIKLVNPQHSFKVDVKNLRRYWKENWQTWKRHGICNKEMQKPTSMDKG